MSNHGQPAAQRSIQAFEKPTGLTQTVLPLGFLAAGGALTALATALAVVPPNAPLGKVVGVLDRVGLDKGPLFLFGASILGVGLVLRSVARSAARGGDSEQIADVVASEVEGVTAILASVQGELGSLRSELGEVRREVEASSSSSSSGAGEANDPMFRLAASLDQLGARVDKRMDAARKEMLAAVESVSQKVDSAQDLEDAHRAEREQTKEFEALRLDLADVRSSLAALTEAIETRTAGATAEDEATLPWELKDEAPEAEAAAESTEEPTAVDASVAQVAEPFPSGLTHVAATAPSPEDEFPEPPPAIPQPSEGLQLIDDMDEDTARSADLTPPLFPDIGGGPQG